MDISFTVQGWMIPAAITAGVLIYIWCRLSAPSRQFDVTPIFSLFWLIPVGFCWAAYFAICLWAKK